MTFSLPFMGRVDGGTPDGWGNLPVLPTLIAFAICPSP